MNRISASKLWQISQVLDVPVQWFFKEFSEPKNEQDKQKDISYETRDTRTCAKLCRGPGGRVVEVSQLGEKHCKSRS